MQFSVVARDRDVVEFQVVQDGAGVVVFVVTAGAAPALEERIRAELTERLAALGVRGAGVEVRRCDTLGRAASGKLQLVIADRGVAV
jgi:hypothetical protein